jgi:hypothetical protein
MKLPHNSPTRPRQPDLKVLTARVVEPPWRGLSPAGDGACHAACGAALELAKAGCAALGPFAAPCIAAAYAAFAYCNTRC